MIDQFRTPQSSLCIQIPATTANLGPGFDCLGMALSLYNEIELNEIDAGIEISLEGEGANELLRDERNLIVQSMQRVFDQVNFDRHGLRIRATNRIPLMGGLGSSSAAIVGGLVAANALCGERLSRDELLALAVEIEGHPDNVAPALLGGLVIAADDAHGPIVSQINVPAMQVVVVTPDLRVSTDGARRILPQTISRADAVFNIGRAALVVQALQKGDFDLLGRVLDDRLHQPFRKQLIVGYDDVVAAGKSAGAAAIAISGSGPSLIAFALDRHQVIAQAMRQAFAAHRLESRAWVLDVDRAGARVKP
jgi:homoserine kinase